MSKYFIYFTRILFFVGAFFDDRQEDIAAIQSSFIEILPSKIASTEEGQVVERTLLQTNLPQVEKVTQTGRIIAQATEKMVQEQLLPPLAETPMIEVQRINERLPATKDKNFFSSERRMRKSKHLEETRQAAKFVSYLF